MKKIVATISIALGIVTSVVAYAETPEIRGNFDYMTGTLHLDGKMTAAEQRVTANMLVLGKTPAQAEGEADIGSNIVYCDETMSDENGGFGFKAKLAQSNGEGEYTLYLGSKAFDNTETFHVYFSDKTTYVNRIGELSGKTEYAVFKDWLDTDDNAKKIGFYKYSSLADKDTAAKIIFDYVKNTGLSTTDAMLNNKVFASGYYASVIKNNATPESYWIEEILLKDSNVKAFYDKYADKNKTYFLQKINKNSSTTDEFEKNILDAIILTVVKYPNGNDNIKTVFETYKTYLGANTSSANMNDYAAVAGKDYANVAACVSAFNTSVNSHLNAGGGGGGGEGRGDSDSGVFVGPTTGTTNELTIKFDDLNPVPWAYKAISVLYEKGVVSGKSEESFCPNDTVLREEFAKMLVCAAGLQNQAVNENVFADASPDAWYTKYINIAYAQGICSGIDNGVFGVGKTVTREDMCVMVYNTLKKLSVNCPDAELTFSDADSFGEYSKSAVAALANMGVVNGVGEGRFEPKGNATRAQAAVIIYNMLEKIN